MASPTSRPIRRLRSWLRQQRLGSGSAERPPRPGQGADNAGDTRLRPAASDDWQQHPVFGFDSPADDLAYVFHYTKAATAGLIAESRRFRFGRFSTTNDPREFKDRRVHGLNEALRKGGTDEAARLNSVLNARRLNLRVGCFTKDGRKRRGFAHPALWSHYGDTHRGVCIVFDKEKLVEALNLAFPDRVLAGFVDYLDSYHQGDWSTSVDLNEVTRLGEVEAIERHENLSMQEMQLTKDSDWSYEGEWRCVINGVEGATEAEIDLTDEIVIGIVLGLDLDPASMPTVQRFGQGFHLERSTFRCVINDIGVLDAKPICTDGPAWRYYTPHELL